MEQLFNDMQQHIATRLGDAVALVVEDCGQLEAVENGTVAGYEVDFPCVLISMAEIEWKPLKAEGQRGYATLNVRLAFDCSGEPAEEAVAGAQARMRLESQLNAAIDGWTFEGCSRPVCRTHSRQLTRKGGIKVYETVYTTTVCSD